MSTRTSHRLSALIAVGLLASTIAAPAPLLARMTPAPVPAAQNESSSLDGHWRLQNSGGLLLPYELEVVMNTTTAGSFELLTPDGACYVGDVDAEDNLVALSGQACDADSDGQVTLIVDVIRNGHWMEVEATWDRSAGTSTSQMKGFKCHDE